MFLLGLLILSACTNDEYLAQRTEVEEGIPTVVKLSVTIPMSGKIETKAFSDSGVADLYVFSFKKDNDEFITAQKYTELSGSTISFSTLSGEQRIFAIGNVDYDMFPGLSERLESWLGNNHPSKSDLTSLLAEVGGDKAVQFANTTSLVSGLWNNEDDTKDYCTVKVDGTLVEKGKIYLKRVAAKVTFKIEVADGREFKLKSYQVCEVPKKVNVWEGSTSEEIVSYSTQELTISRDEGFFTFYMPENIANGKEGCNSADDREKLSKGSLRNSPPEGRVFTYVDKPATYVLLKGSYYAKDTDGKETSAEVVYCIHLGLGAGSSDKVDHKDFSTKRNMNYTYNIQIEGVESIKTEVTATDNNVWRQEGDVTVSGEGKSIQLDAHFEARKITFHKSDFKTTDLRVYVKDPLTNFQLTEFSELKEESKNWVSFKSLKDVPVEETYKYPDEKHVSELLSVEELLTELNKWAKGENSLLAPTNEGAIEFVCFVNEYYYQSIMWPEFVNTLDREFFIMDKTQKQTSGGNSTLTSDASFVIKQHSIQTIYDLNKGEDYNAWGIETINETGLLNTTTNPSKIKDIAYGRLNLPDFSGKGWSTFLDYSKESNSNQMKDDYKNAYYACLQRNRDENGDGVIDSKEKKWYLASSGQYISLWLGRSSLSAESSLFNIDDWVKEGFAKNIPAKYHYIPSNNDGKVVFWAEEGITIGNDDSHTTGKIRNYRCIRDLNMKGMDENNLDRKKAPETLFKISSVDPKALTVTFDYLNANSLKPAPSMNELDPHNERDNDINRVYKSFCIVRGSVSSNQVGGTWKAKTNLTNPCNRIMNEHGWRMPNQAELSVIYLVGTDASAYGSYKKNEFNGLKGQTVFARTSYSGIAKNGKSGQHAYRLLANEHISLVEKTGYTGFIRCVKDNYK
ncbi:DUF4906 domain-containing protein [Parabacteroides distasonis]|nr:DUF4906 domain-containing protein [Parabacteroides distasonis]KDS57214.1 hypothetical protein M095_4752 [Parabacteroides distasonis str. 3999B T(B) 4]KDS63032.1 hypothetical protein M096_1071 [Parabacteroides distasonis str. 3999B T(B) 6]RHH92554.1 DUF4906 domain-containing protein [Parabacteroides distasonis]